VDTQVVDETAEVLRTMHVRAFDADGNHAADVLPILADRMPILRDEYKRLVALEVFQFGVEAVVVEVCETDRPIQQVHLRRRVLELLACRVVGSDEIANDEIIHRSTYQYEWNSRPKKVDSPSLAFAPKAHLHDDCPA
tara:strand:+ start:272 stop:685 length:414 start_codon:yes stop_codon:yes gene_type:complete